MDDIARELGYAVILAPLAIGALWMVARSPLLQWLLKLSYLLMWGAISVVAPIFVALAIHAPRGHWVAAAITLGIGVLLGGFWLLIGWPELRRTVQKPALRIWE